MDLSPSIARGHALHDLWQRLRVWQPIGYWIVFGLGLSWTIWLWLHSPGVPVQDEVGHVVVARSAWHNPLFLLHVWGRPGNTLFYLLPAVGGLNGARLASLITSAGVVLLATAVAQRLGVRQLVLVPLLLWFQPWYNDLGYTALTEIPWMLLMLLAVWLALDRRWLLATACVGWLPLIRHEGVALLGVWCVMLLVRRQWRLIAVAFVPIVLHNVLYAALIGMWPIAIFFQPKPTTIYGSGDWAHFVGPVVASVGLPVVSLSLPGAVILLQRRVSAVVLLWFGLYFALHAVIYRFGLFASGGYVLFLLPLAPAFAIMAAGGAEWLWQIGQRLLARLPGPPLVLRSVASVVACVVALAVLNVGLQTQPRPLDQEGVALQQAADWLRAEQIHAPKIITTHAWFHYFANVPLSTDELRNVPLTLEGHPPGTIVVWDRHYSDRYTISYATLSRQTEQWRKLAEFDDGAVAIFQKQ